MGVRGKQNKLSRGGTEKLRSPEQGGERQCSQGFGERLKDTQREGLCVCVRGQGGRGTEEAGILRRKTAPGSEDAEKEVWAGGPMRDGKVQGKAGLLTVSTMLSLPLCTKDVATVKETRWIDRDDSSAKQQPSLYLKLLFQGTHATMQSRTPNPQPKHML